MTVTVEDLMAQGVVVAKPDHSVDYVRKQMRMLEINAVPVADPDGRPVGIVRSHDLLADLAGDSPVSEIMDDDLLTVEQNADVRVAAGMLRKQRRHHLIVTREGKISGIVSTFDFLELVEGNRFAMQTDENPELRTGIFYVPPELRQS